ncbi:ScbA/BarX family gamma-butyrolactone biosynthesis protein [Streptomyces sp. URMC 124]|uniref:ScbA/BarX family gamma-butyrolactone biosynthesis protein n=1 Tax=Streptomyces sp. URMC 124 TaxID=3423405 RepID=UPI003F1A0603
MSQILLSPAPRADHGTPQPADRSVPCRNVRLQADQIDASGRLRASAADLSAEGARACNATGATAADAPGTGGSGRVAKELVHLSFDDAVYLTGCEQRDATHYTVSAVWPAHTTHRIPGHGTHYETLVVAQTIRQAGLFLAHTTYAAPLDHATLLRTFSYTLNPEAAVDTHRATPLRIDVTATPLTTRNNRTTALHLRMTITAAGSSGDGDETSETVLATGETDFEWIPPRVYGRLRGAYHRPPTTPPPLTPPVPPSQTGRTAPDEVVLSPTTQPRTWQLRHTFGNPVHYDHAVDHVPGLVLIEAANQAAHTVTAPVAEPFAETTAGAGGTGDPAAADAGPCACDPAAVDGAYRPQPTATHTTFHRYAEFDAPVVITTETRTTSRTITHTTVGRQNGEPVFTTTHTAPVPAV